MIYDSRRTAKTLRSLLINIIYLTPYFLQPPSAGIRAVFNPRPHISHFPFVSAIRGLRYVFHLPLFWNVTRPCLEWINVQDYGGLRVSTLHGIGLHKCSSKWPPSDHHWTLMTSSLNDGKLCDHYGWPGFGVNHMDETIEALKNPAATRAGQKLWRC